MNIDFKQASFKDFENIPGMNINRRAKTFNDYLDTLNERGHLNYRLETLSGCGPAVKLRTANQPDGKDYVSLVSNDYLGFTQHPKVKAAAISAIEEFGTGCGASPAIGGHFCFHQQLEEKIARFFKRDAAMIYTTGYTANSATLQCLLKKEDLAIVDTAVHASVYEGLQLTTSKSFPHNNLEALERILRISEDQFRTRLVIIDGVYSQDGDLAPLDKIVALATLYGAYVMIDDAHGIGVIGETGRGVIELHDLYQQVDIITGTFSKTFGHVGGYVVASPELIRYLKFQSRQHLFSVTSTPASACILKSIELLDEEPQWMDMLWRNIDYLKKGLHELGLNTGPTESAIVPVRTGDPFVTAEASRLLLEAGIYTNPIIYPAVSRKDARIRMSLMATHTLEQLDLVLNAFEWMSRKLDLSTKQLT